MHQRRLSRVASLTGFVKPVIGTLFLLSAASAVHAAGPVTFAQAIETSANADANVFAYNNNSATPDATIGTSTGGALGAAIPISFTYLSGAGILPADLMGVQNATISMTASTTKTVATAFGGTFADQAIDGLGSFVDTIKLTRTMAAGEGTGLRTNLLTVTFTGNLEGAVGGTTPSLNADTSLNDTVIYSSDFLSFVGSTQQDFNVAFSSWDPLVTPPSGLGINSDGFFNSATAAGAATFDFQGASSVIPEPASVPIVILSLMSVALFGGRRLRRNPSVAVVAL